MAVESFWMWSGQEATGLIEGWDIVTVAGGAEERKELGRFPGSLLIGMKVLPFTETEITKNG